MTKRNLLMYVGAVLAIALFTFGCGGDDDGLSAEDMARIASAEQTAADALAAVEAAAADDDMMEPEPDAEPGYQPDDPGGTLEDVADRAAAQRIWEAADTSPILTGTVITGYSIDGLTKAGPASGSVSQARLGRPLNLTVSVEGGQELGTASDSADDDAPDLGDPWMGVNLEKDGPGPVMQTALV